jgi:predicted DCC family thiol-disulfide oxidoreductase YuxK
MSNGWTGGQYSLFRAVFGAYLFVHFAGLLPWGTELFSSAGMLPSSASPFITLFPNVLAVNDTPAVVAVLLAIAAIASIAFMVGYRDRVAAIVLWYVLTCLFGRNPLIANPALPFAGWLLLAHALTPLSPYGSWSARGRSDPRGGWSMPPAIYAAAWVVMSAGYTYSGYEKLVSPSWIDGTAVAHVLNNPLARPGVVREIALASPAGALRLATWAALALELLYAPLALVRRVRPWIWIAMAAMHLGLLVLVDFAELSLGMLVLHFFTFDPLWVPGRWIARQDRVLYDGTCGLCHRAVRFVLAEDRLGKAFTFSPLPDDSDSVVVRTEEGRLLRRSDAMIYVLDRLGGLWRAIAVGMRLVPRVGRDFVYDFVARRRYGWFGREATACPVLPPDLRSRFQN